MFQKVRNLASNAWKNSKPHIVSSLFSTAIGGAIAFFVKALSNGGVVLVVSGVLLAGAVGETVQPVDKVTALFEGAKTGSQGVADPNKANWCPDGWGLPLNGSEENIADSSHVVADRCIRNNGWVMHLYPNITPGDDYPDGNWGLNTAEPNALPTECRDVPDWPEERCDATME